MPWQLARARRPKRRDRPLIDSLPFVDIRTLGRKKLFPPDYDGTNVMPNIGLVYPGISSLKLTRGAITATFYGGNQQIIPIRWYRPGPGGLRPIGQCGCKRTAFRFYRINAKLVCRRCCGGIYASQTRNADTRPLLQAERIRRFINPLSGIGQPFPKKPANMFWRTYYRLRAQCLSLDAHTRRKHRSKRVTDLTLRPRQRYRTWAMANMN
jgi:hypothetical protein